MLQPRTKKEVEILPALALSDCLAKTVKLPSGDNEKGIDVTIHCFIVGMVARKIIERFPDWIKAEYFTPGSELVSASHDVGKVSPHFQEMIYRQLPWYKNNSLQELSQANPEFAGRKADAFHAAVSQVAVEKIAPKLVPQIVGQHHGFSPYIMHSSDERIFGGQPWQSRRLELIGWLKDKLGCDWPLVKDEIHALVLAGLTTVADWIGSGWAFDHVGPSEIPLDSLNRRVSQVLDEAGFVQPAYRPGLSFSEVFSNESSQFIPRPTQSRLVESVTQPGVYILEAPMGLGKTEAALYAAYLALTQNRATGIYFALPTQLTSDKIHDRMNAFLEKILDPQSAHRQALLTHGAAWLKNTSFGEEGQPGKSWFNSGKRGLLAPFAVGTVDQALMAAMNVKHGFVRAFGLTGKVVILDEVHSYDSYTGTLLDTLVKVLRELHCTVIILSATLTLDRRRTLLGLSVKDDTPSELSSYPLISGQPHGDQFFEKSVEVIADAMVKLCQTTNDSEALEEVLHRAGMGQQTLWIENTVAEAQEIYRTLASRADGFNIEVGLLHSRFLRGDRSKTETYWVDLYGKYGKEKRQVKGRILVGTQVLEQSLDIDSDFMVTRLCPTDMLFQRLGRLWRHRENDTVRPTASQREAWVINPSDSHIQENPKIAFGVSGAVYAPYVLLRTWEVWRHKAEVALPGDMRWMIEATYQEKNESGKANLIKHDLIEKREKLQRLALVGVSTGGVTLPESQASTRYSETENCEVLLLRSQPYHHDDKSGTTVSFLNGESLFLCRNPQSSKTADAQKLWRQTSAKLAQHIVLVPAKSAPIETAHRDLVWLKDYLYIGDGEESPLRIAVVRHSDELRGLDGELASTNYDLNYNSFLGYQATKLKSESSIDEGW